MIRHAGSMEQLSSRVVYANPWMSVREDEVRMADGRTGIYGVVDKPDFALVIPRENNGFWVVEQFRYPVGRRAVEFPQGSWGAGASGTRSELAQAELREETGLSAGSMTHLGSLSTAYGFCSQGMEVFLAEDLVQGTPDREHTEQDMTHRWVSEGELRTMVRTGEVRDSATIAALALLSISEQP
jgi:8-oxo-dGTP pyrophosphatase MutT (NUDIX family)